MKRFSAILKSFERGELMLRIITLLLTVSFTTFVLPTCKSGYNHEKIIEKDCAFEGTDVIDIESRMEYVLSDAPYSSGISSYSNFKTSYFDNLTYNFGMNYKGSCGYVAIAMILSYYDTFLSDAIVPEQYDINSVGETTDMILRRNSPGVLKDIISNPSDPADAGYGDSLSAIDYYSAIASLQATSLHAKLITIGAARGYYNYDNNKYPCGTTYGMRYNVINDYFSTVLGYALDTDYSIVSCNAESNPSLSSTVRDFAIEQVLLGNPVLLSVSGTRGGHVVVAYDYDSSTDKLYCHMGWNASSTHTTIESYSYSIYKTALAINFNISHSHSNNYAVTVISDNVPTTNFYCYHDCRISTYTNGNLHSYTDHYTMHSSEKHKAYCYCGKYVLRPHAIKEGSTYTSHGHTYGNCIDCGAVVDLGTTIIIGPLSNNDNRTTENGSYMLPNGIYIIKDEDLQAYLDGTIQFHFVTR